MTRYFAIRFNDATPPTRHDWKPWIECKEDDPLMIPLVVNRAIRNRGGCQEPMNVTVFETAPIGTPPDKAKEALTHTYTITPR